MNAKKVTWIFLTLVVFLGLILAKPIPPQKARAQRIHAINHVANITVTLPSTNTPSAVVPGK